MSDIHNQLAVLDGIGGSLPDVFRESPVDVSKFLGGIQASFPILTIKGKTWGIRYRGTTTNITAPNAMAGGAHMPVQFLDVVVIDSADTVSKVYYASGFKENERTPPDCWSVNGITPDPASAHKQSTTCRGCRHNVFGSKIGDAGQKGKACPDNKRLAIVPAHDLRNEAWGGPMMLRLPPASFANFSTFVSILQARQIPPYAVVCRLTFDQNQAYPRIVFTPVRAVTREEALTILDLQKNPQLKHMLTDPAVGVLADVDEDDGPAAGQPVAPPPPAMAPPPPPAPVQTAPVATAPAAPVQAGWGAPPPQAPAPVASAPVASWGAPPPVQQPVAPPAATAPPPGVSAEEWAAIQRLRAAGAGEPIVTPDPQPVTPVSNDPGPIPPFLVRTPAPPAAPAPEAQPVPTPEQLKIQELERQLAEANAQKTRKPRSKPVAPPVEGAPAVTPAGNGHDAAEAQTPVGDALAARIANLVKA